LKKLFIAGCGYIGRRIAALASGSGTETTCLVRSEEHYAQLVTDGFDTIRCSFDQQEHLPELDLAGASLLYLVPPPGGGIFDTRARNFLTILQNSAPPDKIAYISATSVYSAVDGSVVTEQSPTAPASAMGKRRLDAEEAFRAYGAAHDVPVVILRVSGIYGPGRLPLMQIRQGQPLLREEESGPSNRIHADDLAAICIAAVEKGLAGDIFNVSDGHPSSMTAYFNACADALCEPRQPQVSLGEAKRLMSPLMFSYVSESRIVDNSRLCERLGYRFRYPDLAEGLKASLAPGSDTM